MTETLDDVLAEISRDLKSVAATKATGNEWRRGSRWAGEGAEPSLLDDLSRGGELRTVEPSRGLSPSHGKSLVGAMTKALAEGTGSAGGYLVPVEIARDVLTMVRSRSAINRLGPTVVPVERELDLVSISSGATAAYIAENSAIPVSEQTFASSALLKPKTLAALVPVSNRLLRDSSPVTETIVKRDLAEIIALREDIAFLQGGGGAEPTGILTAAGTTTTPTLGTGNGALPGFDELKQTVAGIRAAGGTFQRPGWVFHPRLLASLEVLTDLQGRYLIDAGLLTYDPTGASGSLLGYPFVTSTQIPVNITLGTSTDTTYAIFSSDWQEFWVGENETLRLDVSTETTYTPDGGTTWVSSYQNLQSVFRATLVHDGAMRRPQWFTVLKGIRP